MRLVKLATKPCRVRKNSRLRLKKFFQRNLKKVLTILTECDILNNVKRGYTLKLIRKPKAPKEEQERHGGRIIQKIFSLRATKPLDKLPKTCYNKDVPKRTKQIRVATKRQ